MASWAVRNARAHFILAIFLGGGSTIALSQLRRSLRVLRHEQRVLAEGATPRKGSVSIPASDVRPTPAVDMLFARRLLSILRVCIPGTLSMEGRLVMMQGVLLMGRTLLSDRMAALEGRCATVVTAMNWPALLRTLLMFTTTAIPAAMVNSALKAMQLSLRLSMRKRLTRYLHKLFLTHRAYYSASVLGGLDHAEQRLTEDVDKFCEVASELYSKTLKPFFDLLVFSRTLSRLIGYRGQLVLYTYFIVVGALLRRISPPLARLTAQYSSLDGDFRKSHARLAICAEQVAFNDPPAGAAEMRSLNQRLDNMIRHSRLTALQRFVQQCIDGYLVKYSASVIGILVHTAPLYLNPPTNATANELAGQYVVSMRLMMQAANAMGELVMSYKRVLSLAGHTARVAELVEQVKALGRPQGHLAAFEKIQNRVIESAKAANPETSASVIADVASQHPPTRKCGSTIKLEKVTMWSPDGSLLVRDLSMEVCRGRSVIICGPNGSGKSSILRMLAGLWPLQAGTVYMPQREDIFFLSQKPYTFQGNLAEQLMYPNLPGTDTNNNNTADNNNGIDVIVFDEERARDCLDKVEMRSLIARAGGFNGSLSWDETLSGGERGRLAVARCLYHQPKYAVLDECTAAVSAHGEIVLYKAMVDAGITLLSIAHREKVKQFHHMVVNLKGDKDWEILPLDNNDENIISNDAVEQVEAVN